MHRGVKCRHNIVIQR